MPAITDQQYLKNTQYQTPDNLQARCNIHQTFSTNPYGWWRWYWNQVVFPEGARVLEVGCGAGDLWLSVEQAKLPGNGSAVLTDLSAGMVQECRLALADKHRFTFGNADAEHLPFASGTFDVVFANFILYHLSDLAAGVAELARILRPGGKIYAATVGEGHMGEMHQLIRTIEPGYQKSNFAFTLENGGEVLSVCFQDLVTAQYPDSLWVTEVEPLLAYIESLWGLVPYRGENFAERMRRLISDKISQDGGVMIRKRSGMIFGTVL